MKPEPAALMEESYPALMYYDQAAYESGREIESEQVSSFSLLPASHHSLQ